MLKFNRSEFLFIRNKINVNDIANLIKNKIVDKRISSIFDIKDISSTNNLREYSVLFLENNIKFNKKNLNNIILITNNNNIFEDTNYKDIIFVKDLNDTYNIIINYIYSHDDSLDYLDDFNLIGNSLISKNAYIHKSFSVLKIEYLLLILDDAIG